MLKLHLNENVIGAKHKRDMVNRFFCCLVASFLTWVCNFTMIAVWFSFFNLAFPGAKRIPSSGLCANEITAELIGFPFSWGYCYNYYFTQYTYTNYFWLVVDILICFTVFYLLVRKFIVKQDGKAND